MTFRSARLAVALFIVSVPVIGWAAEVGVAVTASQVMGLALIGLAAVTWWRSRPPFPLNAAIIALLAFFVVATITVLAVQRAPDIHVLGESAHLKSIKQLIGLGFGSTLFVALCCLLSWYGLGLSALRTHHWTTVVFAILTLLQYGIALIAMKSPLANFPVQNSTLGGFRPLTALYGFPRVSLTMVEPSLLATYLLSGWAFWLYAMDQPAMVPERHRKIFVWSGVLLGAAIIVTGSRLAYLIFAALAIGALIVRPARLHRAALVGLSLLVSLPMVGATHGRRLLATLIPNVGITAGHGIDAVEEAVGGQDISVQQRTGSYLVALRVFREHPILGAGLGTSGFYMERYWPDSFAPLHQLHKERNAVTTMLSHYAVVAAETGLLGLLCLSALAIGVAGRLWRLLQLKDGAPLAWGLAAALASYAIAAAANTFISYQILLVWLLLALALTVTPEPSSGRIDRRPAASVRT